MNIFYDFIVYNNFYLTYLYSKKKLLLFKFNI